VTAFENALQINKHHAIVEGQIEIAASPTIFWSSFTNLSQWARWVPGLEEARWIDQPEWGLGSHFYFIQDAGFPLGRTISTFTIAAVSPERAVQWVGPMGRIVQMSWWGLAESEAGTRVLVRQLYHGNWIRLYRWLLFGRRMHTLLARTLSALKVHVEGDA
jgi:hypothetical protein